LIKIDWQNLGAFMEMVFSISDFAEEICKAVEQSASPEMAVANTNR
jgi:hypothetical protein